MAINTAEKRRSAAGVSFFVAGPGVTPNALQDVEWRQQSGWGYSGIAPGAPAIRVVFKRLIPPNPTQPIVGTNDNMTQTFRTWTQQINRASPVIGTGSPESAVEAQQGQLYMDDAGTAGAILYVKRDADIGGDRTQGWILV